MKIRYTHDAAFAETFRGERIVIARNFVGDVAEAVGKMLIDRGLAKPFEEQRPAAPVQQPKPPEKTEAPKKYAGAEAVGKRDDD